MAPGATAMRFFLLVGGLLAFAGLYTYFLIEIWCSSSGDTGPDLDKQLLYVASALGGILGTFFAVSLGIQRKDPAVDQTKLNIAPTVLGASAERTGNASLSEVIAAVAIWLYALVGIAAIATAIFKSVQTPDAIKAIAATFGGYGLAVFGAAFGQSTATPGGGGTQPTTPPAPGSTRPAPGTTAGLPPRQ